MVMPNRAAALAILLSAIGLAAPNIAVAQGPAKLAAGWTLLDMGGRPDARWRWVRIKKNIPGIRFTYSPGLTDAVGTILIKFSACKGMEFNEAFSEPPVKRAASIHKAVHHAFVEFGRSCRIELASEKTLMAGFDPAFAAAHQRLVNQPYSPASVPPSHGQGAANTKLQGQ